MQAENNRQRCPESGHLCFYITRAILKLVAVRESAVYSDVNEYFEDKPDAERVLLDNFTCTCF